MSGNVTEADIEAARESGSVDYKLLVYMMFSMATVMECVLAAYLTVTTPALRRKKSTWFSSCLVLSIGTLSFLSLVYVVVLLFSPGFTYYSVPGCRVRVAQRYLSTVSCFTLACLSLDRYLAICWPLRYYDLLNRTRCRLLFAACWVAPVFFLLLPCIDLWGTMCDNGRTDKRLLLSYAVSYTLGALATLIFYILVALEFCRTHRDDVTCGYTENGTNREVTVVRQRTAKSTLKVLMLYTVLSLPHTLLPVVSSMAPGSVPRVLLQAGYLVHRLHLLLFLPMYAGTNSHFLNALSSWGRLLCGRVSCWGAKRVGRSQAGDTHHCHTPHHSEITHQSEDDNL